MLRLASIFLLVSLSLSVQAQHLPKANELNALCDSLRVGLKERTSVEQTISVNRVVKRNGAVDIYFSSDLSYYPLHQSDVEWLRARIAKGLKELSPGLRAGRIFTNRYEIGELAFPLVSSSGQASGFKYNIDDPRQDKPRFIEKIGSRQFPEGLSDRYIALWQSHGRYFNEDQGIWLWQRACMHRTVEDMFTQSFVLPFLIPMLENSGAYVMTPRERDTQWREIITDNDRDFSEERTGTIRRRGEYSETGSWSDAGPGFADYKEVYTFSDNPFIAGTARLSPCRDIKPNAFAKWTPTIEERGSYSVYISYKTLPESTNSAHYTIHHLGGDTEFRVNQRRGGGTWIYLGTFEFAEGTNGYVTLDNLGDPGSVVSADAVKIGGGMGKLERGGSISGMASYIEGAHYWMQWAGADTTITQVWDTDYTNDYASRGLWTQMMSEKKQIPFDLSLAFHTDAGITPNDSTIGTLAIYTLRNDGEREFSDGRDRIISRLLCDYVQTQVVDDIRANFDSQWSRRGIWDRSYSECRTTGVPAMILELLSHQNLADMKYGLDPSFRFTVCRAVYKGILKTLSEYYGCNYQVQPLPINSFSAKFDGDTKVRLEWKPTADSSESTAVSEYYIVYTRIDGGAFDNGVETNSTSITLPLKKGHIYSYKIVACNDGGMSFPSEILSAGIPEQSEKPAIVVVNNFDKVSAPTSIDTQSYAGFDSRKDSGIPYLKDISFIGENYEFNRLSEFKDDNNPGFGASYDDRAGLIIAGNSFDYPYLHGLSILAAGYPFYSMSADAFCTSDENAYAVDIICGKQGRLSYSDSSKAEKFVVFYDEFQNALDKFVKAGGNVFISGSNIASDSDIDSQSRVFNEKLLGYKLSTAHGTESNTIGGMRFSRTLNPDFYCVECPDGLTPVGKEARTWLFYENKRTSAAVFFKGERHKAVSMGVPLESLTESKDRDYVVKTVLEYFHGDAEPVDHH